MTTSPDYLGNTEAIIIHAEMASDPVDNSLTRDWENATRTSYSYCSFQGFPPAGTKLLEDERNREFVSGFFKLWLPPEAIVYGFDRVEIHGISYDIYGEPSPWYDFEDNHDHTECLLYRREG